MEGFMRHALRGILLVVGTFHFYGVGLTQTLLFQENVGIPRLATSVSSYSGWSAIASVQFVGNAEVRSTQASANYAAASGAGNVFFSAVPGQYLQINQIPLQMNPCVTIGFGLFKSTTSSTAADFLVDITTNGVDYTPLPISLPTGTGTAVWSYVSKSLCMPIAPQLSMRFRQTGSSTYYRIDDITLTVFSPLPVELISFVGTAMEYGNRLDWQTVSETNNRGFYIERSTDGIEFYSIGFAPSHAVDGNSQSLLKYHFTDLIPTGLRQYYRITQIDLDGHRSHSNILSIQRKRPTELELLSIYPNPTTGLFRLVINSPQAQYIPIRLIDLSGRVVLVLSAFVHTGKNSIPLYINNLQNGNYYLDISGIKSRIVKN